MGALLKKNLTFSEGGGITSMIVPYQLGKAGIGIGMGISAASAIGTEMFRQHNRLKMGPMKYVGGPDRMTHNVTSGAVEAIKEVTNDPTVQADMLKKMLRTTDGVLNNLEEFGVDGQFVSAFYGMG
jgi:hypothetical protein